MLSYLLELDQILLLEFLGYELKQERYYTNYERSFSNHKVYSGLTLSNNSFAY